MSTRSSYSRITRFRTQCIFALTREFHDKNKNNEGEIEKTLANLRINLRKKFPFLNLYIIKNVL